MAQYRVRDVGFEGHLIRSTCQVGSCGLTTIRHPFCRKHANIILGVDVRESTIKGAGCGLFALRPFRTGDVILPYTGEEFTNRSDMEQKQNRKGGKGKGSTYEFTFPSGRMVDSTRVRGWAAYINMPPKSSAENVEVKVGSLEPISTESEKGKNPRPDVKLLGFGVGTRSVGALHPPRRKQPYPSRGG